MSNPKRSHHASEQHADPEYGYPLLDITTTNPQTEGDGDGDGDGGGEPNPSVGTETADLGTDHGVAVSPGDSGSSEIGVAITPGPKYAEGKPFYRSRILVLSSSPSCHSHYLPPACYVVPFLFPSLASRHLTFLFHSYRDSA